MAYQISLTATAEADAYAAFERIREVAPASAARWLAGLFAAIQTLADMPARCPLIPEADDSVARCVTSCMASAPAYEVDLLCDGDNPHTTLAPVRQHVDTFLEATG